MRGDQPLFRILPALILTIITSGCDRLSNQSTIDFDSVAGTPAFVMADNLMGTILKSSDVKEVGKKVTFVGLHSSTPKVVFETGMTSPLQKIHEDNDSLTLLLVASLSGSTDAFVINKKTGKFARASAGSFASVYASASVGTCK